MQCRFCQQPLTHVFADLGEQPPSNSYLKPSQDVAKEAYYPLKVWTCESCKLTQLDEFKDHAEIFDAEYAYFSSYSTSWVKHAEKYVADMAAELTLGADSRVIEVASNDGYLLQFVKQRGIPCLGVEPTASTAAAARAKGIESREVFFGKQSAEALAKEGWSADLTAANNVLAHVPDINDFVAGFKTILKPEGVATFEFPHLLQLVLNNQFDTIYHEHFSYLSLLTVQKIFAAQRLRIFRVQEIPTHGGSLRVFATHDQAKRPTEASVAEMLAKEEKARMNAMAFYTGFQKNIDNVRDDFMRFLNEAKQAGKVVAGYGAAAKGNTLLNYCAAKTDLVSFVCDASPYKQCLLLPGSHIPILAPSAIDAHKPDYIVIFPWNLRSEISKQLEHTRAWGAKFVVAVPKLEIF